jgi:hypothetical protein
MLADRELTVGLAGTRDSFDPDDVGDNADVYALREEGGVELLSRGNGDELDATPPATSSAVSPNGTHLFFTTAGQLVPQDAGRLPGVTDLYVRTAGVTHLVNLDSNEELLSECGATLPRERPRSAVSEDGERVFFLADRGCDGSTELYMRVGNEETVELSRSRRTTPDPDTDGLSFYGASVDGSTVFFAGGRLTDDVTTDSVYRYDVESDSLEPIFSAPEGESFDVTPVVVSPDGSTFYFTSSLPLVPESPPGSVDALYVYRDGEIDFVASSGRPRGIAAFGDDSNGIGSSFEAGQPLSVSSDGSELLFASTADLTDYESSRHWQAYLYDHDTGNVTCVSCGKPGIVPTSHAGVLRSSLSADGSTATFQTGERLLTSDANSALDVYRWKDGNLALVSAGRGPKDSHFIGMSVTGRDILFATYASLVAQDVDGGNLDLYDARVGGGFPPLASEAPDCSGEGCQGAGDTRPPTSVPGTLSLQGPGEESRQRSRFSIPAISNAQRARLARTGRLALRVRVGRAGLVRVRARAQLDGRVRVVARGSRRVLAAGTARVTVRLTVPARRALDRTGRLRVRLSVRFSGAERPRGLTLSLRSATDRKGR